MQGCLNFYKAFPDSNFLVILPPSVKHLEDRLRKRGTETEETLATRLGNARREYDQFMGMREVFQFRIVNDDLTKSQKTFDTIIKGLYAKELGVGTALRPV